MKKKTTKKVKRRGSKNRGNGAAGSRLKTRLPRNVHYDLCYRFWVGKDPKTGRKVTAVSLVRWLESLGYKASRERIYDHVRRGIELGYLRMAPTLHKTLPDRIRQEYLRAPRDIQVVDVEEAFILDNLAAAAAERVRELIREVGADKEDGEPVHLALGSGETSRRVAEKLALLLKFEHDLPPLAIHALSSGFSAHYPMETPVAFFSYFADLPTKVEYVGLFSPPVVPSREYEHVKNSLVVRDSFREACKIDIVLTSLSQARDKHGGLVNFLDLNHGRSGELTEAGHIGDIGWQPYSATGPLAVDTGVRAVTLFDLKDLVELSRQKGKHVVLVAGPCHGCRELKTDALRPLLTRASLRACNHLILDVGTARALVSQN